MPGVECSTRPCLTPFTSQGKRSGRMGVCRLRLSPRPTPVLVVASANHHKVAEIAAMLALVNLEVRQQPEGLEIEETGTTYAANAAAVAASYGSISAVTFITAESFLNVLHLDFDGFMVAALALMESPAIVVGVILAKLYSDKGGDAGTLRWREVLQEAFLNGSVFLLIGSLIIGCLVGSFSQAGVEKMAPFTEKLFYGALCFFLLDMGLVAAQRLQDLRKAGSFLIGFAILAPLVNALFGLGISRLLGLPQGDALLFMVLCASASYIAVPAAMRMTVPEANPSLYISTALGLTFPFNVVVGIPLYLTLVQRFIPAH